MIVALGEKRFRPGPSNWIPSRSRLEGDDILMDPQIHVPELPEVENRGFETLAPKLTGRRILDAQFFSHHVVRQKLLSAPQSGVRNQGVEVRPPAHGKFIVLTLDEGALSIHLGMTGQAAAGFRTRNPMRAAIFKARPRLCWFTTTVRPFRED